MDKQHEERRKKQLSEHINKQKDLDHLPEGEEEQEDEDDEEMESDSEDEEGEEEEDDSEPSIKQ